MSKRIKNTVPTIDNEPTGDDEYGEGVKVVKLEYMGPDAGNDSAYVDQLIGSNHDFDCFSIKIGDV